MASRVGKKPIKVPSGVKVSVGDSQIEVTGKLGSLKRHIPSGVGVEVAGDELRVSLTGGEECSHLHGITRTLVSNMVLGVHEGFSRGLELQGVGYKAQAEGQKLTLSVGFSHPVAVHLPEGIKASVEANTKILLKGTDKEKVGLLAAQLRKIRPPDPYKGKGIRYAGEKITLKQGKTSGGK